MMYASGKTRINDTFYDPRRCDADMMENNARI